MSWKVLVAAYLCVIFSFSAGAYLRFNRIDVPSERANLLAEAAKSQAALEAEKKREEVTIKGRVNILLIGEDNVEGSKRSDTVAFVAIDLDNRNIRVLSLPRDTRVAIPNHGTQKLNHAFAYGQQDLLRATVENFLGTPVHYYAKIDFDNFPKLVDLIGGVDIFVGKPMKYVDRRGGLRIDIPVGKNHLDGETALQYVRFRSDSMADIGRIKRQQQFLKAVLHKMYEPGNLTKFAMLSKQATETLVTDMPLSLTLQLGLFVKKLNKHPDRIFFKTLPGEPRMINKLSYWVADPKNAVPFLNATREELLSMDMMGTQVTTAEDFSSEEDVDARKAASAQEAKVAEATPLVLEDITDTVSEGERN